MSVRKFKVSYNELLYVDTIDGDELTLAVTYENNVMTLDMSGTRDDNFAALIPAKCFEVVLSGDQGNLTHEHEDTQVVMYKEYAYFRIDFHHKTLKTTSYTLSRGDVSLLIQEINKGDVKFNQKKNWTHHLKAGIISIIKLPMKLTKRK